jgi:hypothetical protein
MKINLLHIFLSILFITVVVVNAIAQVESYSREIRIDTTRKAKNSNSEIEKRVLWGGGVGLQVGNPTYIELSPKIAYRITNRLMGGGGISYLYYREDLASYGVNDHFETSIYGGTLFAKFDIYSGLFAHTEYEALNFKYYNAGASDYRRKWLGSFFVGGGYKQMISDNGFIELMILYNLNYQSLSPYSSPWVPRISIFL